jgi:putative phosphoserine phosphatase/1-acylglycerol-3-phosphate O-acyltransferase
MEASRDGHLPDVEAVVRSLAAYGSMAPSMLGGVAMGLLNRDRHQVVGYGVSVWIERLFGLTGVTLNVLGEQHLWTRRPAVFIFNHRNNFDPYVALKLVHRDWAAVGKKELAGPLSGVMQWVTPNIAYIDRSNPTRAVESLRTVSGLLSRGVSIVVSPEGTRSRAGEVGTFKKGPFRMAMDGGVPIVPIVIRNADSVTGRNAAVIRKGTIDVAVLPPVPVTDWQAENIDNCIGEVREMFVRTLSNWPADADVLTPDDSGSSRGPARAPRKPRS